MFYVVALKSQATTTKLPTPTEHQDRIIHCAGCTMGGGPRRQGEGAPINC